MRLPFVAATARKDLTRRLADPAALLLWIGIPFVIGTLLAALDGGGAPRAKLLLADPDDSLAGQLLAGAAEGGPAGGLFEVEEVTPEAGRARLEAGEASALLILPPDLSRAVLESRPATLRLLTNPAQRILPAILAEGLEILVEAVFYLQRLLGPELADLARRPAPGETTLPDADVAALAVRTNARLREVGGWLLPPVLGLETAVEAPAGLDFGKVFLPGILFMSLLFVAQGLAADLWTERQAGTLRRAAVAPAGTGAFFAGKLLAGAAVLAAVAGAGLTLGAVFFDLPPARLPGALAWATFSGLALLCLLSLLQFAASSQRTANLASSLLVFPLMLIGGSFFPFEAMPGWMAAIGRWTPNGLALVGLRALLEGGASASRLLLAAALVGLPALAAASAAARLLAGRFGSEIG